MKRPSRSILLLSLSVLLFLFFVRPELGLGQPVVVSGAGSALANGDYDANGQSGGRPAFKHHTNTDFRIEWSGSRWELFNFGESKIYYTNPLEIGMWVPREGWAILKGSPTPPVLSGSGTKGPLSGIYTVGGGSPDFLTISAAVDSLNNNGISNDVTFAMRPVTYDEQVEINFFESYGSSTDSVTITPESGTVTWMFTGAGVLNNYFVRVDSAKHVTIDGIDFEVPAGLVTHATIILFGDVEDLLIKNSTFDGVPNSSTGLQTLINHFTVVNSGVEITDNTFLHGFYGVRGASDILVARNVFQQQKAAAILINSGSGARVEDNSIKDFILSNASYTGIDVTGDFAVVERNDLELIAGGTGIKIDGINPKIRNNMVAMLDASIVAGIDVTNGSNNAIQFNTVLVGASPAGTALLISSGATNSLFNNALINQGGGSALDIIGGGSTLTSNFNNLFTTGALLVDWAGGCCANLADWQASGGSTDPNSISKSVSFVSSVSTTDLHLTGISDGDADLGGIPIAGVTTDFDGDVRSTTAPYMGADEASDLTVVIEVGLTILLEGPYAGSGVMNTTLNSGGYLDAAALGHPYGGAPWNYPGSESETAGFFAANPTVVDWIYLKLYSGTLPTVTVVDSTVGLLLSDGTVVSPQNIANPVGFRVLGAKYYVGVFHRNHLGIISRFKVDLSLPSPSYDFTTSGAQAFGTSPMKFLSSGNLAMFAADANSDGQVTATDFNAWLVDTKAVTTGYLSTDFNMDGQVTASDFNVWLVNTKAVVTSQVP